MSRRPLRACAVAGYAALVQLAAGAIAIAVGPWPWLAWLVLVAWLAFAVHACRHRDLLPGLGRWRLLAIVLWQAPALVFGGWNLLAFARLVAPLPIGCTVLQLWHAVLLPLVDLVPRGEWRLVSWYLWVASALPCVLAAALWWGSRGAPVAAAAEPAAAA